MSPVDIQVDHPQVTSVTKGQPAPFDGTLLNAVAAAEVVVERENAEARCNVKIDREVEVQRISMQLNIDNLNASLTAAVKRAELEVDVGRRQVEALSQDLERAQKQGNATKWHGLYYAGGVVTGVLIIVAGAFAVRGVREANL